MSQQKIIDSLPPHLQPFVRLQSHDRYTPAPDIVHESAGHAPFLVDGGCDELALHWGGAVLLAGLAVTFAHLIGAASHALTGRLY